MSTFVLVHGAWGGAHTWKAVRPRLWEAGHHVFTPSLTGIGERAHLASPQVDLTTHIDDVVNVVLYEDLSDIVLLGFSYGGMVVTGALDDIGQRVRELVYLDAFVPADGDSLADLAGWPVPGRAVGAPWSVPPIAREMDDPELQAWSEPRRTAHPLRCFTEPVRLATPIEEWPFGRTYIKALADPRDSGPGPFWAVADRVRTSSVWRYHEIDTNHMIPQNRPDDLAKLLLDLV
jgi:pimeloyl-ACP methyl ester carboxylesterase